MPLTSIEQVRLLIGDTDTADQILSDAQVQHFLDEADDVVRPAAAEAAFAIHGILSLRAVSETTGAMSVDLSRRAELYYQRALDLGGVPVGRMAGAYVGGVSQAELDSGREDEALPPRVFTGDLHSTSEVE